MTHRIALIPTVTLIALSLGAPLHAAGTPSPGASTITSGPKPDKDDDEDDEKKKKRARNRKKDHAERRDEGGREREIHRRFLVGAKGGAALALTPGHSSWHAGGGYFVELVPSHDWLAIEISQRVYSGTCAVQMPIEVLFKKPLHVSRAVELYLGVGPVLSLELGCCSSSAHVGVAGVFGSYFWASDHVGFLVEAAYTPIFTAPATHEILWSGGIVFGW